MVSSSLIITFAYTQSLRPIGTHFPGLAATEVRPDHYQSRGEWSMKTLATSCSGLVLLLGSPHQQLSLHLSHWWDHTLPCSISHIPSLRLPFIWAERKCLTLNPMPVLSRFCLCDDPRLKQNRDRKHTSSREREMRCYYPRGSLFYSFLLFFDGLLVTECVSQAVVKRKWECRGNYCKN